MPGGNTYALSDILRISALTLIMLHLCRMSEAELESDREGKHDASAAPSVAAQAKHDAGLGGSDGRACSGQL